MKVKTDKLAKALKIFDNLYNEYVELPSRNKVII